MNRGKKKGRDKVPRPIMASALCRSVGEDDHARSSHDFDGEQLYLFHCHILEHEDAGTMINCKFVDPQG